MASFKEEDILNALKVVKDPDLHRDIVTLGFVKNIRISGSDIKFDLQLTTPSCPVRDQFVSECEHAGKFHERIAGGAGDVCCGTKFGGASHRGHGWRRAA